MTRRIIAVLIAALLAVSMFSAALAAQDVHGEPDEHINCFGLRTSFHASESEGSHVKMNPAERADAGRGGSTVMEVQETVKNNCGGTGMSADAPGQNKDD